MDFYSYYFNQFCNVRENIEIEVLGFTLQHDLIRCWLLIKQFLSLTTYLLLKQPTFRLA